MMLLLKDYIKKDFLENNTFLLIVLHWRQIVGDEVFKVCSPYRFKGGVLYVHTLNSAWNYELTFYKKELLQNIAKFAGGNKVKDVVFKVGVVNKLKKEFNDSDFKNTKKFFLKDTFTKDEYAEYFNFVREKIKVLDPSIRRKLINLYLKKIALLREKI